MKKLLLLTILFVCAAPLQATTIQMTNPSIATIIIPDGSTITSAIYEPPGNTQTGRWIIDFTFAGGHGQEWDDYNDGGQGWIGFDAPVSNLSINWFSTGVFDMGPTFRSCMNIFLGCPNHGTFDFSGPTTGVNSFFAKNRLSSLVQDGAVCSGKGTVHCNHRLGGTLNYYYRDAA